MFTAIYDLARSPVSYDIGAFLVWARMVADHSEGPDAPLRIAIEPKVEGAPGSSRDWGGHDEASAQWRLWNIVTPACQLIGATVELRNHRDGPGARLGHFAGDIITAARAGRKVPLLFASTQARRYVTEWFPRDQEIVTITIRDHHGDPARNSRREEWAKVLGWFAEMAGPSYVPILLDDSEAVMRRPVGHLPVLNVDLRLALYERAAMNLLVCNGPAVLCQYSAAPFMQFGVGGHHVVPRAENWARHWRDLGLEEGDQLPWSRPDQRLVYAPDTLDNIAGAFGDWLATRKKAA